MTTSHTTTIAAVAEQLRQGSLTIPDLLWRCRRRIADLNDRLNAVVTLAPDVEAQAEQREEELRTGKDRGPLHGIPLLVKDNIDVAGMPSTVASPIFASALPAAADAAVIAGLREAGAIILGKTNMDEFAAHVSGRTSCWGPTVNPWHMSRNCSPGGSSSGSAAAAAAGMCLAALGTDTGGSVRLPAAWCGLFGLRPSWGLLPMRGIYPRAASMDVPGVFTRSPGDMIPLLRAMLGSDLPPAARTGKPRVGIMSRLIRQLAGSLDGVNECYEEAVERWTGLGCTLVEVDFPLLTDAEVGSVVDRLRSYEFYRDVSKDVETSPARKRMNAVPAADYAAGRDLPDSLLQAAQNRRRELAEATQSFFAGEDLDALLLPASLMTAPRLDAPAEVYGKARLLMNLFSITGNPVLVYPGGSIDGMPFGMQLVGPVRTEARLIELAGLYEGQFHPFAAPPSSPGRGGK